MPPLRQSLKQWGVQSQPDSESLETLRVELPESSAGLGDRSTSEEEEAVDAVVVSFLEAASQDRVDAAGQAGDM